MQRPKVVVLAPIDYYGHPVQEVLRNAISDAGGNAIRLDEAIGPGARWADAIMQHIREADLIIADASQWSPNVFVELGFAIAHRKPMLLLVNNQAGAGLPSDLAGFAYLTYDPANLSELSKAIKTEIGFLAPRRTA